jgi:hypothetical protein
LEDGDNGSVDEEEEVEEEDVEASEASCTAGIGFAADALLLGLLVILAARCCDDDDDDDDDGLSELVLDAEDTAEDVVVGAGLVIEDCLPEGELTSPLNRD